MKKKKLHWENKIHFSDLYTISKWLVSWLLFGIYFWWRRKNIVLLYFFSIWIHIWLSIYWNFSAGVSKDGLIRHFFHRPSKAYTTGTRKRRKVHSDEDGSETRWHKTGKTRPVYNIAKLKGYKKILVLYTNYGKQRKPEKTNWVMHQYHLGSDEEEKEGELVVSKVFYQTQPRQCGSLMKDSSAPPGKHMKGQSVHAEVMNNNKNNNKSPLRNVKK